MKILALETATLHQSLALLEDSVVLGIETGEWGRSLTRHLLPAIHRLLDAQRVPISSVDGLAISIGPGSFTGLRVGLSTLTAFRLALGIPIVGVSTLEGLAWNVPHEPHPILPMIAIRPGLVYWALYQWKAEKLVMLQPEQIGHVQDVCDAVSGRTMVLGDGWVQNRNSRDPWPSTIVESPDDARWPTAVSVGRAGYERLVQGQYLTEGCAPNYIQPSYAERGRGPS